jgi:hypothetical protein
MSSAKWFLVKERRSKMKKLLIIPLVLSAVSICEASLIFTINGEPQPDEITMGISDKIELGARLAAGHTLGSFGFGYYLSSDQAEFLADNVVFNPAFDIPGSVLIHDPQRVRVTGSMLFSPDLQGPAVLFEGLLIHCLGAVDVEMEVWDEGGTRIDGVLLDIWDPLAQLTIHQIPEPITVTLLGFGVLLLRRRR